MLKHFITFFYSIQYVIFPVALKGEKFLIERPDTHGGNQTYASFEDLEKEFGAEKVQNSDKSHL